MCIYIKQTSEKDLDTPEDQLKSICVLGGLVVTFISDFV